MAKFFNLLHVVTKPSFCDFIIHRRAFCVVNVICQVGLLCECLFSALFLLVQIHSHFWRNLLARCVLSLTLWCKCLFYGLSVTTAKTTWKVIELYWFEQIKEILVICAKPDMWLLDAPLSYHCYNYTNVGTPHGKFQLNLKEKDVSNRCHKCTSVTRRKCQHKDGNGKSQVHYLWMCETHHKYWCPQHGTALTDA